MRMLKVLLIAGGLGTLSLASSWTLFQSQAIDDRQTSAASPKKALDAYKLESSRDFLKNHAPDIDLSTDIGKKRLDLLIDQYTNTDSSDEIIVLYEYFPDAFDYKEHSSITVAKAILANHQTDAYKKIRQNWKGREREKEQWFFLDAEALVSEGNQSAASSLLCSRSFEGEAETERLVRLALIHLVEDPKLSWKYLTEASQKDPENACLNSFKAALLESANKRDMALNEHISAIQKDPENPLLREELADFYLRTCQYSSALKILQDSLSEPSLDSIWLKTLFWNRVIQPVKYRWSADNIPQGDLKPLIEYLVALPPGIFWNSEAFQRLPNAENYLANHQETFWLRLLMALKNGSEQEAFDLLQQNSFQTISCKPELESNLKTILAYRIAQQKQEANISDLPSHTLGLTNHTTEDGPQKFLDNLALLSSVPISQITMAELSKDFQEVITSKEAFTATFLAAGWDEAALQLHALPILPSSFPGWISYALTEAIDRNKGKAQAIQFALKQTPTPELNLLISQLSIAAKQPEIAIGQLKNLYKRNDPIGIDAAKLLSKIYLEQGDNNAAKEAILAQPNLANELASKEILARIALQSGDIIAANTLYLNLEKESSEAKSYLARKAFADKDWKRAKFLTQELIKIHPNNDVLKENLHKIDIEEQKENFTIKR